MNTTTATATMTAANGIVTVTVEGEVVASTKDGAGLVQKLNAFSRAGFAHQGWTLVEGSLIAQVTDYRMVGA